MSWDHGFNFRATDTYVTDAAGDSYVLGGGDHYPTTRDGVTFGWENDGRQQTLDRNASNDPKIAGINYNGSVAFTTLFYVDLPATGDYLLRLAMGDQDAQTANSLKVYDQFGNGGTLFLTLGPHNTTANQYYDATDTPYTNATWPGSNSTVTVTATGGSITLELQPSTTACTVAHFFLSQITGAATAALTGTALAGITETDIVTGTKTVIATLTGDTWIPN